MSKNHVETLEYERNEILSIAKYDFSSKDFASMLK